MIKLNFLRVPFSVLKVLILQVRIFVAEGAESILQQRRTAETAFEQHSSIEF